MKRVLNTFHLISHIKYPLLILALYFLYRTILFDAEPSLEDINTALILMGIGISLDSLKDYGKLNWLDKKVLHRPKRAKIYLLALGLLLLFVIMFGAYGYFFVQEGPIKELSIGMIVFAIGCLGMLKSGIQATKSHMETITLTDEEE